MFTYKKENPEGRYRCFHATTYNIKLKRKKIGFFFENHGNPIKIYFSIEKDETHNDGNPNCSWMNIHLKKEFKTVEEVKEFLKENFNYFINKYKFHTIG